MNSVDKQIHEEIWRYAYGQVYSQVPMFMLHRICRAVHAPVYSSLQWEVCNPIKVYVKERANETSK